MSNFCGGIKLGDGFKLIDGIICDANATTVDRSKAVSTCGQLWDGALFAVAKVGGTGYITLHHSEGEDIGEPISMRGNCGVGLDGRFFKMIKGAIVLQNGFILTVDTTPKDAIVTVTDVDGEVVDPISGSTKQFLLSGIGDTYTVTVTKTGYTTEAKQVKNTGDQTLKVVMKASA